MGSLWKTALTGKDHVSTTWSARRVLIKRAMRATGLTVDKLAPLFPLQWLKNFIDNQ